MNTATRRAAEVAQMKLLALRILHEFREGHEPEYEQLAKLRDELDAAIEALRG